MALWRNRRRIEAAVLGERTGAQELQLFAHLRACEACRAHYEPLALAAEALSPAQSTRREEARLWAALEVAPRARERSPTRWMFVFAAAAAVLTVLLWPARPPDDEVVWRGGAAEPLPTSSLLLYARDADGGAVHLAADFPLAGVVKLARAQQVQLFVRHPLEGGRVVVYATSAEGHSVVLAEAVVNQAREHSVAVGSAFSLSRLEPGAWRLTASISAADAGALEVSGTLEVGP